MMKKIKLYKVLNKGMISPYQNFQFKLGKVYHCENFDESDEDCSRGFYATDIDGLPYAFNTNRVIYNVTVWGKFKEFNEFKRRYEYMRVDSVVNMELLLKKAKRLENKLGYQITKILNPINPLLIKAREVTNEDIALLKEWASVWNLVWNSMWNSVMDSMWNLVRNSVRDSVRASVWALIGDAFPNVKKWKYIDHKPNEYPFKSVVELFKKGFVPSYDGKKWRLHTGRNAKIVFEITREDLLI